MHACGISTYFCPQVELRLIERRPGPSEGEEDVKEYENRLAEAGAQLRALTYEGIGGERIHHEKSSFKVYLTGVIGEIAVAHFFELDVEDVVRLYV